MKKKYLMKILKGKDIIIINLLILLEYVTRFQPIVRGIDYFGSSETIIGNYMIYECIVEERMHQIEEVTNSRVSELGKVNISKLQTESDVSITEIILGIHESDNGRCVE